ncbi:pyridoxal phosphate-dependent aminotransferase [Fusibacter paucivorans]|uniref:cysteine-S-conjugate beta-lyase n=1 Tax=Fusibacter paucivorans TaxID=76009 RepID=A0ABS5PR82_9FIRM|nr:MalY/PatB family protein [Fusibacter paucivorans]MBS7527660.1 pyridoxal phosphate-dependent aminotransferase [Fusibacter paucivorans]
MKYNFDQLISRHDTNAVKIDLHEEEIRDGALSLWVADMDFSCAEPIIEALHQRIDRKIFGYTRISGVCKEALIGWFDRRYQWRINSDDIIFSPGVVSAIGLLINLMTEPDDGIIVQNPVYYPFYSKIEKNGRRIVYNQLLYAEGRYEIDFEDLDRKLADPKNKGIIFCSPHNPVGRVWREDELKQLVSVCKKYNKWIICDEIHCDLTRVGVTHTPILKACPDYAENIVACVAPSKSFNLAGMQLSGIIIPNADLREQWKVKYKDGMEIIPGNPFSMVAFTTAYNECEDWLDQLRGYLDSNIDFVIDFVKREMPKAHVIYPEGTYLVWIDLNAYCSDYKELENLVRYKAKVILDEGFIFGNGGECFERINVASPKSVIEDCMYRIRDAVVADK